MRTINHDTVGDMSSKGITMNFNGSFVLNKGVFLFPSRPFITYDHSGGNR